MKSNIKTPSPQDKGRDIKEVQALTRPLSSPDPLGSLQSKLRDDPMPNSGADMEPLFDADGPSLKKKKNTYFV